MRNISLLLFTFVITLLGSGSAWAQSYIGNVDNTTEYGQATSTEYTLTQNKKLHLEFTNYSDKAQNYHNWLLMISGIDDNEVVLRADDWWWCGGYNKDDNEWWKFTSYTSSFDWTNFKNDMDGASVIIDVSTIQAGDYSHVVIKAISSQNGRNYIETLKLFHSVGDIKVKVSVDHSHITTPTATITDNASEFYDFTNASSLDSRFEGIGGGTGSWGFVSGQGYKNSTSGTRQFRIKNLHNGDQVTITYSGNSGTFNSTNAKDINGTFISQQGSLVSDQPFYMTADGMLEVNIPRNLYIQSIEINKEWSGSVTPTVAFTTPTSNSKIEMTVGQSNASVVSANPTKATPVYTSSNTAVATVDAYGNVTAVGVGEATITATLTVNGSSQSDTYTVSVISVTTNTFSYDFTGNEGDISGLYSAGTTTIDETTVTILDFTSNNATVSYPRNTSHPDNRFGVVDTFSGNSNKWFLRNGGLYAYWSGNKDFYILDLHNGDKVTMIFNNSTSGAGQTYIKSNNTNVTAGTQMDSGTAYTITADGPLQLSVGRYTYIETISIQREGSPALSFSPSSTTYELTSLNFTEPTLITQPSGVGVTYSSSDPTIAKPAADGDIMFIKPGTVNIIATAVIGGQSYSAQYSVVVKAGDALFTMSDESTGVFADINPYSGSENAGVLATPVITTVPLMKMTFGNGSNTVLVTDYGNSSDPYLASMILDEDGWQHMSYTVDENNRVLPSQGTFYKFEPAIGGQLTIRGQRRSGKNNTIVLVDASDTQTTTGIINTVDKSGNYTLTANGNAIAAGTTVNLVNSSDNSDVLATITFGVNGGADFKAPSSDESVTGYTAFTEGNGENGTANGGTLYIIKPNYSGEIEVAVVLNADKKFYVLEDDVALSDDYNGKTKTEKYYGTFKFPVTKGKTYKVYCTGSKLGFYGCSFSPIRSYPVVKEYTFSNGDTVDEAAVTLTGGHTYYLYGNNTSTNGGERQVFYLHGFTYTTDFKFPYRGVVMDGRSNTVDGLGYYHVASANTYTATASTGVSYSIEYKDKDGKTQETTATVNSSGVVNNISEAGSYIVTASVESNGQTYKTYYVLTVPYTLESASTEKISWKFNGGMMETKEQLNTNADEWAVYYKVRRYNNQTRALEYLNVPVRANGISVLGDNARYFDNTAGLLFKANAHDFGTTSNDLQEDATLSEKLKADPTTLENNNYITIFNGTSMTIPNLKAGQYVRVKWSRYSQNNGDQVTVNNVTDLNGTNMSGQSISIGAGARVQDNGGTGYHEFKVAADGDVTFTASQDGWINIYEVDVANQFIPTNLRLQTVDNTQAGSSPSTLSYIRRNTGGSTVTNEYSTVYGRIQSQSNVGISYYIKGDPNNNATGSRTGTLSTSNCTVSNNTLNLGATGHGRFTLVQEGKVDGTYVLDRNEYEIKVYEYDYAPQTYPHTWNLENMSDATDTALSTESGWTDANGNYRNWTSAGENKYQLTLEPENLIAWNTKAAIGGEATAISELNGLGIRPADITKTNSIVLGSNNTGIELSSTEPQILTVPSVASGATAYIRVKNGSNPSVTAKYADGTEVTPNTIVDDDNGYSTYSVAGAGKDIDFYLADVTVMQSAVSKDTKTISAAGYATEARDYPVDYTMTKTLTGDDYIAYKITGVSDNKVIATHVEYVPAGAGVMITGNVTAQTERPIFTTDVNRTTNNMEDNLLIGLLSATAVDQSTTDGNNTYYNYILANKGRKVIEDDNGVHTAGEEITGLGYYLLYKQGTILGDNNTYSTKALKANSAYLRLSSFMARPQELNSGSSTPAMSPQFCFFLGGMNDDETTDIEAIPINSSDLIRGEEGVYYTLQGVRVTTPAKGNLYILNGKKVFIK